MKLVKFIDTSKYDIIEDIELDLNLHIDRTDGILYWKLNENIRDYCYIRSRITDIVESKGFNNLRDLEKDVVLEYTKAASQNELVAYIMSSGKTVEEASMIYLQKRAIDIRKSAICFSNRINNPEFTVTIMKYLGQSGGEIFLDNCRNFISDLRSSAVLGTNYGNSRNGLLDYVEDTGNYVGSGTSTFFTLPEQQAYLDGLKKEIKDIIYYGYTT